jgi:hypothetical protein
VINKNCVFIIGAGASQVYGFPSGIELKNRIIELLSAHGNIDTIFSDFDPKLISVFKDSLLKCGRKSVDAFLENRDDLISIGKFAISSVLTLNEDVRRLFINEKRIEGTSHMSYQIERDWLVYLYDLMNTNFDMFHENNVQFITFNYDRSIETFFFEALKNSYNKNDKKVAEIMNKVKIVHVHGQLGFLPWQNREREVTREYKIGWENIDERKNDIRIGASGIKIIHEANMDSSEFLEARTILKDARSILFLGFGFSNRNIERLKLDTRQKNVWGTFKGLTQSEIEGINQMFFRERQVKYSPDIDCLEFLRRLSRDTFND